MRVGQRLTWLQRGRQPRASALSAASRLCHHSRTSSVRSGIWCSQGRRTTAPVVHGRSGSSWSPAARGVATTRETRVKDPRLPKQTGASRAPWLGRHGEQLHLGAETGAVSRGGTGTSRRGPTGHPEATNRCSRVRVKRSVDASRRAGQGVPLLRMVPDGTGMQVVQIPAHHV